MRYSLLILVFLFGCQNNYPISSNCTKYAKPYKYAVESWRKLCRDYLENGEVKVDGQLVYTHELEAMEELGIAKSKCAFPSAKEYNVWCENYKQWVLEND